MSINSQIYHGWVIRYKPSANVRPYIFLPKFPNEFKSGLQFLYISHSWRYPGSGITTCTCWPLGPSRLQVTSDFQRTATHPLETGFLSSDNQSCRTQVYMNVAYQPSLSSHTQCASMLSVSISIQFIIYCIYLAEHGGKVIRQYHIYPCHPQIVTLRLLYEICMNI